MAQTQSVDPKTYYGYLFAADKKPTKVLDALLRGIGTYIVDNIGNTDEKCLTPAKLATFYKAVGGNYDSLFVDVPPPSISWIYASIGCQHTLQPTNDDFQPPSIPALTIKGFVRWQSIEILLGPEEHVPFIQTAIQTFGIKHPDTGEPFPTDLPEEAFPLKPDAEIERWHNSCAEKLKLEARGDDVASRPELPPRPKVQAGFKYVPPRRPAHSHSPGRSPRSRPEMQELFEPPTRPPIQFQHVSSQHVATHRPQRPPLSHSPSHRAQQFLAPEADRMPRPRRRSNPENMIYSPGVSPGRRASELYPPIPPPTHTRRHSHPRPPRAPSVSTASDSSGSDDESRGARLPRRSLHREPSPRAQQQPDVELPPGIRHNIPPTAPVPPSPIPVQPIPRRVPRRAEHSSSSDERRKSWASNVPMDNTGKLSPQFLQGVKNIKLPRRRIPRPETRDSSRGANNVRWKELNEVREFERRNSVISVEESEPEVIPSRRNSREEGRSSSERERNRGLRYTDRDRDRELDTDRDVPLRPKMRPEMRRSSSHDTPRTEKEQERERARDRDGRRRRIGRDRERERDRSPVRGVDGRRYPPTDAYR